MAPCARRWRCCGADRTCRSRRKPGSRVRREVTETVVEKDGAGRDTTRQVRRSTVDWAPAPLQQTRADAALDLEHRQKGLLWYDTYTVAFRGTYVFQNPDARTT